MAKLFFGRSLSRAKRLKSRRASAEEGTNEPEQEPIMVRARWGLVVLVFVNVLGWSVLGLHERSSAAPQDVRAPFDNAVQQRGDMIRELQAIKTLLQEQNMLLRAALARTHAPDKTSRP